jgi:SNF2-related domain
VAIDFVNCLHLKFGVKRALVVCPLSGVGVWESEIPKHTPNGLLEAIEWRIINYERVYAWLPTGQGRERIAIPNKDLRKWKPEVMIVDESHRIGRPTSLQARHIYQLGKLAQYRVILTGTFFHRGPLYIFGQMKFLSVSVFGAAWTHFKSEFAVFGGATGKEVKRYQNLKKLTRKLRPWIFHEKPPTGVEHVHNVIPVHLDGQNLAYYGKMDQESVISVDGNEVSSSIALSRHLRLQMIAGGWIKTDDSVYKRVGDCKAKIAKDRLQEYADNDTRKVVVGARFLPELQEAAKAAKAAGYVPVLFHGGVRKAERDRRIKYFSSTAQRAAFIAQVSTGKESIDLSCADTMLWYSLPESYVDFDQFEARIQTYNETRTLLYDYIVASGTRDEVTYESLKLKKDVAVLLLEDPELVERITAKR